MKHANMYIKIKSSPSNSLTFKAKLRPGIKIKLLKRISRCQIVNVRDLK